MMKQILSSEINIEVTLHCMDPCFPRCIYRAKHLHSKGQISMFSKGKMYYTDDIVKT